MTQMKMPPGKPGRFIPFVHAPEWEPYARDASAIEFNERHHHFIKCRAEMAHSFDNLKADFVRDVFFPACDYVRGITVRLDAHGARLGGDVLIDRRFKVVELALSSFDLFL